MGGRDDSPRHRQVLELLQRGYSYDDVAATLGVSINTVRTHVRVIYERLGVTTKVEAVMTGLELGIIDLAAPSGQKR